MTVAKNDTILYMECVKRFIYNEGELFYKIECGRSKVGSIAGTVNGSGRKSIIMNKSHFELAELVAIESNNLYYGEYSKYGNN